MCALHSSDIAAIAVEASRAWGRREGGGDEFQEGIAYEWSWACESTGSAVLGIDTFTSPSFA